MPSWTLSVAAAACVIGTTACSASSGKSQGQGQGGAGGTGSGGTGGLIDPDGGASDAGTFDGDPVTCEHAASARTYVGCDFYPTVHPNVVYDWFDFAVVVANAGVDTAHVTIELGGQMVAEGDVTPNGLQKFHLPWVPELKHFSSLCDLSPGGGALTTKKVPDSAFHVVSTAPVTVYQFNPLEYGPQGGPPGKDWGTCNMCFTGCGSFTNDASLLLPSTAMTGSYVVSSYAGWNDTDGSSPGYITVTGLHDGTDVQVKVGPSGTILAGGGIAGGGPGDVVSFTVGQGDVMMLVGTPDTDLGGSQVQSSLPVQVMTGVPHLYIPSDTGASDHIEESVFPVETLGTRYHVARPTGPNANAVPHVVRLFGVVDGTNLTYPAGPPPGAPSTLSLGEVADLGMVEMDFEVVGDQAFQVATYQVAGPIVGGLGSKGDPAQSTVASVEQYRTKYVFLAPDDYDESFADVVLPEGANVLIDGQPIAGQNSTVGDHRIVRVPLGPGVGGGAHLLVSDMPVGLQVMGYGFATSYQYPGGLNLKGIAPPLPPVF